MLILSTMPLLWQPKWWGRGSALVGVILSTFQLVYITRWWYLGRFRLWPNINTHLRLPDGEVIFVCSWIQTHLVVKLLKHPWASRRNPHCLSSSWSVVATPLGFWLNRRSVAEQRSNSRRWQCWAETDPVSAHRGKHITTIFSCHINEVRTPAFFFPNIPLFASL